MAQRLEVVRLLVQSGGDVAHQDAHGDNVLHWCARESRATLLRFFLLETDASAAAAAAENYKRETVALMPRSHVLETCELTPCCCGACGCSRDSHLRLRSGSSRESPRCWRPQLLTC